jgi:isoleucyl-tRNA synthetase
MIAFNNDINWVPQSGKNAFHSWLSNLRDNSISKQRVWGTPVPVWKNDKTGDIEVIGSLEELKEKAGKVPDNLHKPWIDDVTWKGEEGGTFRRVPDIMDVWIDAGSASWSCLYYPKRTDLFEKFFPADFILEAKEQVRGWFNLLMVASILAFKKPSFKACYMHGMLTDVDGKKMSKSLGNVISPYELVDKHGADTLRYYMCETKPGLDINFSWDEAKLKFRNLQVLWNIQNYLLDLTATQNIKPTKIDFENISVEEKFMLSKLNSIIKKLDKAYDSYHLNEISPLVEDLFMTLSKDYIKFTRDKEDKQMVANILYECMLKIVKLMAPNTPFISEAVYQNLKEAYSLKEESVHLCDWPEHDEKLIAPDIEEEVRMTKEIISMILSKREEKQMSVRWPLARAEIEIENPAVLNNTQEIIMNQTNVKKLLIKKGEELQVDIDTVLTPSLKQEGFTRQLSRRVQNLRKKAGLEKNDSIKLIIETNFELEEKWQEELVSKVGATSFQLTKKTDKTSEFESTEKISGEEFRIIVEK